MKRFMRKNILIFLFGLLGLAFPQSARGQFLGYTAPQTNQQTLATNTACNGGAQSFTVANFGQISHAAQITSIGATVQQLSIVLQGSSDGVNFVNISDVANGLTPNTTASVSATGYNPVVRAQVVCSPVGGSSTFSLSYSGVAGGTAAPSGVFLTAQVDKQLALNAPAGTSTNFPAAGGQSTPYGNSSGLIMFSYLAAGPANSNIIVTCRSAVGGPNVGYSTMQFNLQTTTVAQVFPVPATPCLNFLVAYTAGGASAATYDLDYIFNPPGTQTQPPYLYTRVTSTGAIIVKTVPGFLHNVNINTGAAGTVTVFDIPGASCTGTPAVNQVAIITATTTTLQTFTYDVAMSQGICVKASATMDITVSAQ
jgi:hypothetical protein